VATMIKCDRCGTEEETKGTTVAAPPLMAAMVPAFRETALPDGWRRPTLPQRDGSAWKKDLCPGCVNALWLFMEGDGAVPGLLEPETLAEVEAAADPRPHLTARAVEIAGGEKCTCGPGRPHRATCPVRCSCAGVGFGTEDCVPHHPDGLERGTHLKCFQAGQPETAGDCPGIYRRGMFAEHMERWHGITLAERSKPCPYCAEISQGIMQLGQHIAKEHPGDWQAWIDGGQKAG
jgi:hypothetical protein